MLSRRAGFTLIELTVALALLALLAALALPSFGESIRKGRRSEAFAALAALQLAQERWRGVHAAYAASVADLGLPETTLAGHYTIRIEPPSPAPDALHAGYVAIAEGVPGTSQARDAACRQLGVRLQDGALGYAGCGDCAALAYAASHPCWPR